MLVRRRCRHGSLTPREHRAIARELHELHSQLTSNGIACSLTTTPALTLLIGTDGGGVVTIGITARHPGWFASGAAGADLTTTRRSLTSTIHDELEHRAHRADAAHRSDVHQHTIWPSPSRGEGRGQERGGAACTA